MAYVIKRNRAYEYRSVRRGGKVTSVYVGGGSISAECAEFFHDLEAGRRTERKLERADWQAERTRLAEAERAIVEADAAHDELATAALVAAGFHRPQRGRWRRRRAMKTKTDLAPMITPAQVDDLLDRIERAEGEEKQRLRADAREMLQLLLDMAKGGDERTISPLRAYLARRPSCFGTPDVAFQVKCSLASQLGGGKDVWQRDQLVREIEAKRDEIAGPGASPLERLLAERVAFSWFDANVADMGAAQGEPGGMSIAKAEYLSRQRSRATARFLAACKALATVRRLALPALQVNIEVPAAAPAPEPFNPARADLTALSPRN